MLAIRHHHTVDSTERFLFLGVVSGDTSPTWFDKMSVCSSCKIRTDVSSNSEMSLLWRFFTWLPFTSFLFVLLETAGPRIGSDLIRRFVFLQSLACISGSARDNEDNSGDPGGVQNDEELLGSWPKGSPLKVYSISVKCRDWNYSVWSF